MKLVVLFSVADAVFKAPEGNDLRGFPINRKHPFKRLSVVNRAVCRWLRKNNHKNQDFFCHRFSGMIHNMGRAFDREKCSYYNPSIKFGGPNPDEEKRGLTKSVNANAKNKWRPRITRVRREGTDTEADLYHVSPEELEILDQCDGTEKGRAAEFCKPLFGDNLNIARSGVSEKNYELKKFLASAMKWSSRHIYECYGQRVHEHNITRIKKMYAQFSLQE